MSLGSLCAYLSVLLLRRFWRSLWRVLQSWRENLTLEIGLEREIKRELKTHLKGASFLGLSGFPTQYVPGWE